MRIKLMTLCMALCCLCFGAFAQNVPDYVPTDGLVAWYPLNGNANDESGNGYDGVIHGASASENRLGIANSSLSFDGFDDFISVSNEFNFEELTLSVWIKQRQSAETYSAIIDRSLTNNIGWWIEDNSVSHDSLVFTGGVASGNYFSTQAERPQLNVWTHICAVYSQGNQELFINGELMDYDTNSAALQFPEAAMYIGKRTNSAFWDGCIDDVALWNRALNEEEILALYNAVQQIQGCTDSTACNFDSEATSDDGSCLSTDAISLTNQIQIDSSGQLILVVPETLQNWTWNNGTSDTSIAIGSGGIFAIQGVIGGVPEIGSVLSEGLVFAIDSSNQSVYIASHEGIGSGSEWGCYGTATGATGNGMGDGITNTQLILDNCMDLNSAAAVASNHGEDWYLPSFEELDAIRTHLHDNGFGNYSMNNPLDYNWYWSSTECPENSNWAAGSMHFSDGFYGACNNKNSNPGGVIAAKVVQGDFCLFTDTISIQVDCTPSNEPSANETACGAGTFWDETTSQCLPILTCQEDLDGDGVIGVEDLMQLLSSFGTMCEDSEPETGEFTCGDPMNYHGYDYATVQIGGQCWFAENLRTELYENGDLISTEINFNDWINLSSGARISYSNDESLAQSHGLLYNWYAVMDSRKICPSGWHEPSNGEWQDLETNLGLDVSIIEVEGWRGSVGFKLKNNGTSEMAWNGSNEVSFNGTPSGFRQLSGGSNGFVGLGSRGEYWTTTNAVSDASSKISRSLDTNQEALGMSPNLPNCGFSVRCLKDSEE